MSYRRFRLLVATIVAAFALVGGATAQAAPRVQPDTVTCTRYFYEVTSPMGANVYDGTSPYAHVVGYLQPGSYADGFAPSNGWTAIEYPPYDGWAWVHASDLTAVSCEG